MGKKNKTGRKNSGKVRQTKKDVVMGTGKKNHLPLILATLAVLVAGAGIFVVLDQGGDNLVTAQTAPAANADIESLSFPAALFSDGQARHYRHTLGDQTIRFFVLKSADGVIRAAFDACDVCWPANRGYYQDGDVMVCRNCGRRFASVLVNEVKGGCNPAPLERAIEGDQVVIRVEDIKKGAAYFNFSAKA
jgi:uncharacterized membrane protein